MQSTAVHGFLPLLREHGYPVLAAIMAGDDYSDDLDEDDLTFGLTRILDGIDVLITTNKRRHAAAASRPRR